MIEQKSNTIIGDINTVAQLAGAISGEIPAKSKTLACPIRAHAILADMFLAREQIDREIAAVIKGVLAANDIAYSEFLSMDKNTFEITLKD